MRDADALDAAAMSFLRERHLATLSTLRADGSPHAVAIAFTWDPADRTARVITAGTSQKARNARRGGRGALTQVDGARWITLEGPLRVSEDPAAVADAERRHATRYRTPRPDPRRVVIEMVVDRVLGRWDPEP